jgi:hypothetical protein
LSNLALDCNLPILDSIIAGTTDIHHHSWLTDWVGVSLTFCSNCDPSSWDYRCELLHPTQNTF